VFACRTVDLLFCNDVGILHNSRKVVLLDQIHKLAQPPDTHLAVLNFKLLQVKVVPAERSVHVDGFAVVSHIRFGQVPDPHGKPFQPMLDLLIINPLPHRIHPPQPVILPLKVLLLQPPPLIPRLQVHLAVVVFAPYGLDLYDVLKALCGLHVHCPLGQVYQDLACFAAWAS
jgi:hypothetical protein